MIVCDRGGGGQIWSKKRDIFFEWPLICRQLLGDLPPPDSTGGGPFPSSTAVLISKRATGVVAGNHAFALSILINTECAGSCFSLILLETVDMTRQSYTSRFMAPAN